MHSHEASVINTTCPTCSFSGSPEACVHPGELKASTIAAPAASQGVWNLVHPHLHHTGTPEATSHSQDFTASIMYCTYRFSGSPGQPSS